LVQHDFVPRDGGGKGDIVDFAFLAEEADFLLPGGDAGAVQVADAPIEGDFLRVAGFGVHKLEITSQLGIQFVGSKEMNENEFMAA
jgi:hypothetical protein